MTLFFLAYCAGILTIATPCILPILPFVPARVDEPFKRGDLLMLLPMAFAFAGATSLASFAGAWAIDTNRAGRQVALAVMTLFGLSLLLPVLAARLATPIVAIGSRLSTSMQKRTGAKGATASSPQAGPIVDRAFEIEIFEPGVRAYAVTFGYRNQ